MRRFLVYIHAATALVAAIGLSAAQAQTQPTFSKAFTPDTIGPGSTSSLVFTIEKSGGSAPADDLAFTDVLPAGIAIAAPSGAVTDCAGGVLSAPDGGGVISLTGARLGPGNTCGVRVNVVGTSTATNVSGALTSSLGTSGTAGATLTVDSARPGFSKAFAPNSIPLGATSTLTFTFDNTANTVAIGKLEFRDILPAGMVIAPLPNASTDCASGTISSTVESGANAVSFVAFGSLGAGSTCTASIDVTTAGNGSFENVSGELDIAGFVMYDFISLI